MRKQLEYQADRIEALLALHKVPSRVTGGAVTPRWVRFQVLPAIGARISTIKNLHEEIAAALDAPSCRVSRRGAALAVEIPRDDPQPVRLLPLYRQLDKNNIPSMTAILGLAEDGLPLMIRFPSPDVAHALVTGTTGSGKTVLLQAILLSLAMLNDIGELTIVLVDPKGHAFAPFSGLPHLARPIIRDVDQIAEVLRSLARLMDRRGGRGLSEPAVIVVIDELADVLLVGGTSVQYALTRLTQRGRDAGIHIIAATQKPTAAVLGPLVKANFPVRLVGRVTSIDDARTASGWSGTGAERLLGRGDFLAVAEGRIIRFQAAHVSADEINEIVTGLSGARGVDELSHGPQVGGPVTIDTMPEQFHIPPCEPQVDPDLEAAKQLIASDLWENRESAQRDGYRWGFLSDVCFLLFDCHLEGYWYHKTRRIVALAERISTSTTAECAIIAAG